MTEQTIHAICGAEPARANEDPFAFQVGMNGVTKIERREENYGDHGLLWFDIFKGSRRAASMNGRHVAVVAYKKAAGDA